MRYLLIITIVLAMLFLTGCFVTPEPGPGPDPIPPIECVPGYYVIHYTEWTETGCPDDPIQPAGTYWCSYEGEMFLIGDTVPVEDVFDVYGICPITVEGGE